ncbi:MAG: hypothetical protein ACFB22_08955 [Rhodothalassiaceae bacterium]
MRQRLLLSLLLLAVTCGACAIDTPVSVRVLSNDAKFVGDGVGGAAVRIIAIASGTTLAQGRVAGDTGDTDIIMRQARPRDAVLASPGAARFDTVLDLDQPTRVRIEVIGPLGIAPARRTVMEERVLIPGADYRSGNGLTLRLPGMAVQVVTLTPEADGITVTARVTKMCGCPITADGLWPSQRYSVTALRYDAAGRLLGGTPLSFSGRPNLFGATVPAANTARIVITAFDPATKDGGMADAPWPS